MRTPAAALRQILTIAKAKKPLGRKPKTQNSSEHCTLKNNTSPLLEKINKPFKSTQAPKINRWKKKGSFGFNAGHIYTKEVEYLSRSVQTKTFPGDSIGIHHKAGKNDDVLHKASSF